MATAVLAFAGGHCAQAQLSGQIGLLATPPPPGLNASFETGLNSSTSSECQASIVALGVIIQMNKNASEDVQSVLPSLLKNAST